MISQISLQNGAKTGIRHRHAQFMIKRIIIIQIDPKSIAVFINFDRDIIRIQGRREIHADHNCLLASFNIAA
ncbi:hypothetical protein SDC9_211059 [bioreactor metagenome]|uniref:Uncharacterized protein n=1 Tax=bioreactor metagenome TaxID=1076179 RepID=A0A645JI51_9ZZZZ